MTYCAKCKNDIPKNIVCKDCTEGSGFEHITGGLCNDCVRVNCPLAGHSDQAGCEEFEKSVACEGGFCECCTDSIARDCGQ